MTDRGSGTAPDRPDDSGSPGGADSPGDADFPDGSVGRYVRERWGAVPRLAAGRAESAGPTTPATPATRPETDGPVPRIPEQAPPPEADRSDRSDRAHRHPVAASRAESANGASSVRSRSAGSGSSSNAGPSGVGASSGTGRRSDPAAAAPTPAQPNPAAPTPAQPNPAARPPARGTPHWTEPGAVDAQQAQRARSGVDLSQADLSSARLLRPSKRPPQSGWRRVVYLLSGRFVNPGESPTDVRRRELGVRVNKPLLGCYKIAMLSLKGGVGKTTTTATLGSAFASLRGDRVVAVDANPDRGTLSQKIPLETSATVRHLLRDAQRVRRYTDVRAYTSQGPSRLEVLASEQDPAVSEAFSEDDYRRTVTLLEHFYNIVLTDCGTGLMHSAMYGVLGVADQLIIVSSGSIDGARSASATMDWLDAHGHQELVRSAVAVINCVHRSAGGVDLDRVAEHFSARCRAVVRVPFDAHLEEGAEIDLDRLEPGTRMALLELAAAVADDFPS